MQQVMADTRFWWRALDAQSPEDPAPSAPFAAQPHAPQARRAAPQVQKARAPQNPYALRVPKADRRPMSARTQPRRRARYLIAACSVLVLGSSAAAALLISGKLETVPLQAIAADRATGLLIGLGFGIEQVSLTGHRYASDRDIFEALDLPNVRTFASLDAAAVLKRIERLPWVDTAQISRVYPGTLSVQVRERRPYAVWARGEKSYLIDVSGRLLAQIGEPNGWQLPRISGEGASSEALMLFTALRRYPDIEAQFASAERVAERRWSVVLKNGTRLELGADREDEGFSHVASKAELRQTLRGPAFDVDVRTPGRIAMRPLQQQRRLGAGAEGLR